MPTVEHLASMSPEEFIKFLKDNKSEAKSWPLEVIKYSLLRKFRIEQFKTTITND